MNVAEIQVSYQRNNTEQIRITNSKDLYDVCISTWNLGRIEMQEEVKAILLDRGNQVLGVYELSRGGLNSSVIDIKLLMSVALKGLASGLILVHNHPSGNTTPSDADYTITRRIKEACNYFDITLVDHLIIAKGKKYRSFADEGVL